MVDIDITAALEDFREFIMASTCRSYAPRAYLEDAEVFAERPAADGEIYVEAVDKVTLKQVRDITFVNARDVLGIIYRSKSGNTALNWRQVRRNNGKVTGTASTNTVTNLAEAGMLTMDWVNEYIRKAREGRGQGDPDPQHRTPA